MALFAVRLLVGGVFLWAGLQKLPYPFEFLDTVYQYKMLGPTSGLVLALLLPVGEIVVGMCLLLNVWTGGGILMASVLSMIFVAVQTLVIIRGDSVDCGCFGSGFGAQTTIGWWTLLRTALLAGLAILGYMAWTVGAIFTRK